MTQDISVDLYLHDTYKLHRGHLIFLKYFVEGTQHLLPSHKFLTELVKTGMVYDDEITQKGKDLWEGIRDWTNFYEPPTKGKKIKQKPVYSEEFKTWWKTFPASDNFEYAGQEFTGTQSKRTKQDECSVFFEKAAEWVGYEALQRALEYEIEARKDQSVIRKENQISFMSGTLPYLRNKKYEVFLPLAAKGKYQPKSQQQDKVVNQTIAF